MANPNLELEKLIDLKSLVHEEEEKEKLIQYLVAKGWCPVCERKTIESGEETAYCPICENTFRKMTNLKG